ncbi:hypothetical protein K466DRAFT_569616 [Polyporus arcularius HHB13444]|uniref:Uncharacterized protein n=1 Tax=Polyporus arcularius HHB13444 TaxID=1314778 RepID=A0A5C3NSI8_9APHY|nr:hypothetical protein K466DRAFT_569616 [Polyporus arcularius HHB13444]
MDRDAKLREHVSGQGQQAAGKKQGFTPTEKFDPSQKKKRKGSETSHHASAKPTASGNSSRSSSNTKRQKTNPVSMRKYSVIFVNPKPVYSGHQRHFNITHLLKATTSGDLQDVSIPSDTSDTDVSPIIIEAFVKRPEVYARLKVYGFQVLQINPDTMGKGKTMKLMPMNEACSTVDTITGTKLARATTKTSIRGTTLSGYNSIVYITLPNGSESSESPGSDSDDSGDSDGYSASDIEDVDTREPSPAFDDRAPSPPIETHDTRAPSPENVREPSPSPGYHHEPAPPGPHASDPGSPPVEAHEHPPQEGTGYPKPEMEDAPSIGSGILSSLGKAQRSSTGRVIRVVRRMWFGIVRS